MVQTLRQGLHMYITDMNQKDWDEFAEQLNIAIKTVQHRMSGDTPLCLFNGRDARSTLEATLPLGALSIATESHGQ